LWADQEEIDGLVELELITGFSAEDTFLHCGYTYSDFCSFGRDEIVWLSQTSFSTLLTLIRGFRQIVDHF
jgi:hypothetical protein